MNILYNERLLDKIASITFFNNSSFHNFQQRCTTFSHPLYAFGNLQHQIHRVIDWNTVILCSRCCRTFPPSYLLFLSNISTVHTSSHGQPTDQRTKYLQSQYPPNDVLPVCVYVYARSTHVHMYACTHTTHNARPHRSSYNTPTPHIHPTACVHTITTHMCMPICVRCTWEQTILARAPTRRPQQHRARVMLCYVVRAGAGWLT